MDSNGARRYLERHLPSGQWQAASLALGRYPGYIFQYIRKGVPAFLGERDREILCALYGLEPDRLKPPPKHIHLVGVSDKATIKRDDQTRVNAKLFRDRANRACRAQIRRALAAIHDHEKLTTILALVLLLAEQADPPSDIDLAGHVEDVALFR